MGLSKLANLMPNLAQRNTTGAEDDFHNYTTAGLWTSLTTSSGTTAADDVGTVGSSDSLKCLTAATTSDQQGYATTKAPFLIASGHGYYAETRFQFTQNSSNSAAVYFGIFSANPQGGASTAVPAVSYSGAIIYKLSGEAVWRCQSSNGATKTSTTSVAAATDGNWDLRIDVKDRDSLSCSVTYSVNGQYLRDSNGVVITHTVLYASLVKAKIGGHIQASGSNAETMYVDFTAFAKSR